MSLPINVKFKVSNLKAPPPTKNSLWPALKPAPVSKVAWMADSSGRKLAEKSEGNRTARPITSENLMSLKAKDGRPRRANFHGRSLFMKLAIPAIPLLAIVALLGLGCANEKPRQTAALDVGAKAAPQATGPVYQPSPVLPAYQPVPANTPPTLVEPAPTLPAETKAVGQTYTVQKGDTLFHIAKLHYGDGNKWKKIADANPGLSPSSIKIGQKITIPQ